MYIQHRHLQNTKRKRLVFVPCLCVYFS